MTGRGIVIVALLLVTACTQNVPSSSPVVRGGLSRLEPKIAPTTTSPRPVVRASRATRAKHVHPTGGGRSLGVLDVTAYCHGTITASGKRPRPGMAATLDRSIRFGTRLQIAGRVYRVEDRIGHSSDVDLWFDSCVAARVWGRRQLEVTVLR